MRLHAPYGCGAIFSITTGGTEKVLHTFNPQNGDGSEPVAGLIDVGGTLYGTTRGGGKYRGACGQISYYPGCGTVFRITPRSGAEIVLHTFGGQGDGFEPDAPLTDVKGTLYGTTFQGGPRCFMFGSYHISCGTVFSITTGGTETILHTFDPGRHAHWPDAGLIRGGRKLYGTTTGGGTYHKYGTVFSITPSGTERVIHSFGNGADGRDPAAGLIEVKGTFYGTTREGGAYGDGTVFSITSGGTEKVLYSFAGGSDGARPLAGLINVAGTLYGTTSSGGGYGCYQHAGCGTVFSVTTSGMESVLYSFAGGSDGANPLAGLTDVNGTLYGTTYNGGTHSYGTVFALTP